jgi:hypothetical protein
MVQSDVGGIGATVRNVLQAAKQRAESALATLTIVKPFGPECSGGIRSRNRTSSISCSRVMSRFAGDSRTQLGWTRVEAHVFSRNAVCQRPDRRRYARRCRVHLPESPFRVNLRISRLSMIQLQSVALLPRRKTASDGHSITDYSSTAEARDCTCLLRVREPHLGGSSRYSWSGAGAHPLRRRVPARLSKK